MAEKKCDKTGLTTLTQEQMTNLAESMAILGVLSGTVAMVEGIDFTKSEAATLHANIKVVNQKTAWGKKKINRVFKAFRNLREAINS